MTPKPIQSPDADRFYMKRALKLALRGAGGASPNPMVGAVIVKDGRVAGEGWHERAGGPHAEVNAIGAAGSEARGATLYVTLEPCNHYGKTPPCTRAVIGAGISRVVAGMGDPNPHVAGGGADELRRAGIEVRIGVIKRECRLLNQPFLKFASTGLPHVTLKAAATLDGSIASSTGDSKWISNERSRAFVHRMRSALDGIVAWIGTVLADDPLLTARPLRSGAGGRQPARIILDCGLQIPLDCALVRTAKESPLWIACSEAAPKDKEEQLSRAGALVLRAPVSEGKIDLRALLEELGRRQITSLLVEGGSRVLGSFLESGLADAFCFFYAPRILGDARGVRMAEGRAKLAIADAVPVFEVTTRRFGQDILVSGRFREQLY